jgi:uncharacterized protein (DUF305 family)
MIAHARGAIAISAAELAAGHDTELKRLAHDMLEVQERQIAKLRAHQRRR